MPSKKTALLSNKVPGKVTDIFENLGYGCVLLQDFKYLDTPVSHHPDMLFSLLPSGKLLCDERYLKANPELCETELEFLVSKKHLGKLYPNDIVFDALIYDDTVYGNVSFIAPEILESCKNKVNVKQGYTLCSTLVTDKCAITADKGIYNALKRNGVDVLEISPDRIVLEGYNSGFIGGASAFEPISDTVVFFGDISAHKDFNKIADFLSEHGHSIKYLSGYPLTDFGGAKLIIK